MDVSEERIFRLIDEEKGDRLRLEDMINRIRKGKTLFHSDIKYLESLDPDLHIQEKQFNLENLPESQPKPKPQKAKPIKFAVSYSNSRRGSAKIHRANCHNVQRSSQEGDIKWNYYTNHSHAKNSAETIGQTQPYGWKYAGCCMRNFPYNIIIGSILTSLFLGILGGLVAWYFTRDIFGNWAKTWLVMGGLVSLIWTIYSIGIQLR